MTIEFTICRFSPQWNIEIPEDKPRGKTLVVF